MTNDSNEQDNQPSSGGAEAFTQADVDALLGGTADAQEETPPGGSAVAPRATDPPEPPDSADPPPPSAAQGADTLPDRSAKSPQAVTQEDIDVLVDAAQSEEQTPDPQETRWNVPRPAPATPEPLSSPRSAAASNAAASMAQPPETQPYEFQNIGISRPAKVDPKRVTMLNDVNLRVRLQLGRTRMLLEDVLNLGEGSVVELDKLAGDPVDVLVNDRLVARGEVLVLNDVFCVRVCEVLSNDPHRITV